MIMTTPTDANTPPPTTALEIPPESALELGLMISTICFEDKNKKNFIETQRVFAKKTILFKVVFLPCNVIKMLFVCVLGREGLEVPCNKIYIFENNFYQEIVFLEIVFLYQQYDLIQNSKFRSKNKKEYHNSHR